MSKKYKICVLGGSGFVGHHLVCELARQGHEVTVVTRHAAAHRDLLVLPTVSLHEANIHDMAALIRACQGHDVLINLVAILNEPRDNGKTFAHVHIDLAQKIIETRRHHGIKRILHMSALHADAHSPSGSFYLTSKGKAEDLLHSEADFQVTSFRPSVIFGPGDSFFNRFAGLLRVTPLVLPLACGNSRFAPVYVNDVVQAFVKSLHMSDTIGQRYNLCGPQDFSLKELVEFTARTIGVNTRVVSLGKHLSKFMANVFQLMPFNKPMTRDNFRSLQIDSICQDNNLQDVFAITPARIQEIVPHYLQQQSARQNYNYFRRHAHRDE